jgi:hypothetical protein
MRSLSRVIKRNYYLGKNRNLRFKRNGTIVQMLLKVYISKEMFYWENWYHSCYNLFSVWEMWDVLSLFRAIEKLNNEIQTTSHHKLVLISHPKVIDREEKLREKERERESTE